VRPVLAKAAAEEIEMSLDDLLIAIIIIGIGLSGAYLRAELLSHRRRTAVRRLEQIMRCKLLTRLVGLLAAFLAIAAQSGCHVCFSADGCPVEGGCGPPPPPTEASLGGTLSGLVGSQLVLQNTLQNTGRRARPTSRIFW
jgi:hypothetical protein